MKTIEQETIEQIEKFRERAGLSRRAFGINAANDPKLLGRLARGRGIMSTTINKIREYIQRHSY